MPLDSTPAAPTQPAATAALEVRRFRPDDLQTVLPFLAEHFPHGRLKADERYFRWRFADGPYGSSLDHYWLALCGGELIGQLAAIRDRLWIGGELRDVLWLVDLIVAPRHHGELASLRLFQGVMSSGLLLLTTGAGEQMEKLYRALGWRRMRIAETYYLPLRPSRLLRMAQSAGRTAAMTATQRCAARMGDVILPRLVRWFGSAERHGGGAGVESVDQLAVEAGALFEELRPKLGVTAQRQPELFGWKFGRRPVGTHFALVQRREPDLALRSYLIAKRMERPGVARWVEVVDYLADPAEPATIQALIAGVVREALRWKADFVRWRLSQPAHLAELRLPWWQRRTQPVSDEVFAFSPDGALLDRLQAGPWHLTSLVSDRADYGRDETDASGPDHP